MKISFVFMAASLGILAACSGLNELNPEIKSFTEEGSDEGIFVEQIIFEAPVIRSLGEEGETRASLSQEGNGDFYFGWEAKDTVGIFPNQGAQVFFEMKDGIGTNVATFDGGGWKLRQESVYSCYYPFVGNMYMKPDAIPVSFAHQEQTGVSKYEGVRFFLAAEGRSSSSGALRFSFNILNTVIRIKAIGLPAGTYTKLTFTTDEPLFIQEGLMGIDNMSITGRTQSNSLEVTLKDFTLTEASTDENPVLIYLTSAPVNLSGRQVTIQVYSEDNIIFTCERTPSLDYTAGHWGGLICEMVKIEPEPVGNMESLDDTDDEIDI